LLTVVSEIRAKLDIRIFAMLVRFDPTTVNVFDLKNFAPLRGRTGLYFIFLLKLSIPYPFKNSKLIYIGMSESRINSIGKRLRNHLTGESKNKGIAGYNSRWELKFTYLDYEFLKHLFPKISIELMETIFLENFAETYGSYPICNNRRGKNDALDSNKKTVSFKIDWNFFKE